MVARLQRWATLGLLCFAVAWVLLWAPRHPGVALAGAAFVLGGHAIVLGLECLAMARANRMDPAPRASRAQLAGAWLRECRMAPIVFCWRQPFRADAVPDRVPHVSPGPGPGPGPEPGPIRPSGQAAPSLPGVILVHGLLCNRGFWTPWLRALAARDQPFIALSLEPAFGAIDDYLPALDAAVRRMTAATGVPPALVCHSMGGIVARAWLAGAGGDSRVARVLTLGSPHHGTRMAALGQSKSARQVRIGSMWLAGLAAREGVERRRLFTCWYSSCDSVVFPASTATLPDADNRLVVGQPHVGMAFDGAVMAEALALLGRPSGP